MRNINEEGLNLIKEFEGLKLVVYRCSANKKTVGYGHLTSKDVGQEITLEQAEAFLLDDVQDAQRAVSGLVQVPLNDNEYSALVCFVFNVGQRHFQESTLLKLLNKGFYETVPAQLMRWNKVNGEPMGGLSRRRAAEAKLWTKPVKASIITTETRSSENVTI